MAASVCCIAAVIVICTDTARPYVKLRPQNSSTWGKNLATYCAWPANHGLIVRLRMHVRKYDSQACLNLVIVTFFLFLYGVMGHEGSFGFRFTTVC